MGKKLCNQKHRKGLPDSYWLNDPEVVFKELNLKEGNCFLDLGCGIGSYAIHASSKVGKTGRVIAIDRQTHILEELLNREKQHQNIITYVADITQSLPIKDETVDVCFICTVLHCLNLETETDVLFRELFRILKKNAKLVVVDCNLDDLSKCPPLNMRISPQKMGNAITKYNFIKVNEVDLGFNYMLHFKKED